MPILSTGLLHGTQTSRNTLPNRMRPKSPRAKPATVSTRFGSYPRRRGQRPRHHSSSTGLESGAVASGSAPAIESTGADSQGIYRQSRLLLFSVFRIRICIRIIPHVHISIRVWIRQKEEQRLSEKNRQQTKDLGYRRQSTWWRSRIRDWWFWSKFHATTMSSKGARQLLGNSRRA